jgi:hypothetical protein
MDRRRAIVARQNFSDGGMIRTRKKVLALRLSRRNSSFSKSGVSLTTDFRQQVELPRLTGPLTRAAIRRFQHDIGAEMTGHLSAEEASRLVSTH